MSKQLPHNTRCKKQNFCYQTKVTAQFYVTQKKKQTHQLHKCWKIMRSLVKAMHQCTLKCTEDSELISRTEKTRQKGKLARLLCLITIHKTLYCITRAVKIYQEKTGLLYTLVQSAYFPCCLLPVDEARSYETVPSMINMETSQAS